MKRVLGVVGLGLALAVVSSTAAEAAPGGPASHPRDDGGLGSTGELVSGLVGGAGTLGFLLPSPNGSGANFVNGVMAGPGAAITGAPTSILPYGLLDGGKP